MPDYFITGLPRSGTAWLANFLTWNDSFCYHEGLYGHDDMESFITMINQMEYPVIGDCDTTLTMLLPFVYQLFPDAKYVFIRRNKDDVSKSLAKAGFPIYILPEIERNFEWCIRNIPSLVIDFDDIFEETEEIWDYIGLTDFPHERHDMLKHMKMDDSHIYLDMKPMNYSGLTKGVLQWQQ